VWAHNTAALQQTMRPSAGSHKVGGKAMAQIYRDIAINQMIATTEEAMSHAIDWWGDLPTSMKEAIDKFRVQLGAAIDSVEFVKRALDRTVPETSWKATEQR
jgi:hypothetical protein